MCSSVLLSLSIRRLFVAGLVFAVKGGKKEVCDETNHENCVLFLCGGLFLCGLWCSSGQAWRWSRVCVK
jgi:hypothetical protein